MPRQPLNYVLLNAASAAANGKTILVKDYRHKEIVIATAGIGAGESVLLKVKGSFEEEAPSFGSAASISNIWDYIQVIDLEDGSAIEGDTGITISEANDVKFFSINIDGLAWVCVELVTVTGTGITVTAKLHVLND